MGKNAGKPVRIPRGGGGGGTFDDDGNGPGGDGMEKDFHSKEFAQAELDRLLNPVDRPTWEQFKEQQRKKGELEGAEAKKEEEEQRRFRAELDAARKERFAGSSAAGDEAKKKKKHKDKHKDKKHKHKEKEKKEKHKSKKKRRRDSDSSSSSDSEGAPESKKDRKDSGKADGPISLRAFFSQGSDSDS